MTTDIHTHLGLGRTAFEEVMPTNLEEHVDTLIQRMDTFGIRQAVLTPNEPNIPNELYISATDIYPDRLFSACSVIPRPIDIAREKLNEYVDRGCIALVLNEANYYPMDPAVYALVHRAVDQDLCVYLHNYEMTNETISFLERMSTAHPSGKFVVLHMGGLFGFPKLLPLMYRQNIWLEISITFIKLVESHLRVFLDALTQDIGVRRLVFGSEHHTEYPDLMASLNMIDLNVENARLITSENAWQILGLSF